MCMVQRYEARRGDRGAKMDFHTDSDEAFDGQLVAQLPGSDVLTLTVGANMNFWVYPTRGPHAPGVQRIATALRDGEAWIWKAGDDMTNKHGVWFPLFGRGAKRAEARRGVRYAIVFRWSNGRVREFDLEYPHRIILSEDERERIAQRIVQREAEAMRWVNPPPSVHHAVLRACA